MQENWHLKELIKPNSKKKIKEFQMQLGKNVIKIKNL